MRILIRNRRAMLGIGILVFFAVLALAAPLLTPYDPVHWEPRVAERLAKPIWYKHLLRTEDVSENFAPVLQPGFPTNASLEEFEFATNSTGHSVSAQFDSEKGNGCVAVVLEREETEDPFGQVEARLTKEFNFPYNAPPKRFTGSIAIWVEGAEDVPVKITVFFEQVGGKRFDWWSQEISSNSTGWITPPPNTPIDSYAPKAFIKQLFGSYLIDPARLIFPKQGNYIYGVEMLFNDTQRPKGAEVKATAYIDNLNIKFYGTAFGILGTDQEGRDIFTQLLYGARISLIVGLLSALLSTLVGLTIGLVSGYLGGLADQIMMRFTDMLLVVPDTPLYIVLMAVISPSVWNLILLITVIGWTGFARVVRSQVLSLKERPFIEAAKAVGASKFRVIFRHILPNVMSLVYVTMATAVPYAILSEAWLSWLGLYDPYVMTWGRMLHDVQSVVGGIRHWWWIIPPGLCIAAISLSFILLGYALDEILNPKLRKRY